MADISKIKLPSGNEYDIKDAVARQMIAGGVSFNIVWTAADYASSTAPSTAKLATIPAGVNVYYDNGAAYKTGTLAASDDTVGKFYLIYSKTQTGSLDLFDEYVTIGEATKTWEKIGDTLIDLSGVVTNVTLNKSTDTVIGSDATFTVTQPTVSLAAGASGTGKVQVATNASGTTKYLGATASGGGASWNSKDTKTVVTSVTASQSNLATGSVTGVQATTTTASKATATTTQITATGGGNTSTTNTDWLKGVSVSDEVLTIGAATMATQSTTQFTFADVTVPIKNTSATTVATGQLVASGGGATIATNVSVGSSVDVIGSNATFTNTQPTVALASGATAGTGVISVAYGAAANGTASVIGASATFTNTQPTIALETGADAGTGVVELATDATANGTANVIGSSATFTNTQPTIALAQNDSTATGRAAVITSVSASQTYIGATATNGNVAWNSKDSVTVLKNDTSITVTKGE